MLSPHHVFAQQHFQEMHFTICVLIPPPLFYYRSLLKTRKKTKPPRKKNFRIVCIFAATKESERSVFLFRHLPGYEKPILKSTMKSCDLSLSTSSQHHIINALCNGNIIVSGKSNIRNTKSLNNLCICVFLIYI